MKKSISKVAESRMRANYAKLTPKAQKNMGVGVKKNLTHEGQVGEDKRNTMRKYEK